MYALLVGSLLGLDGWCDLLQELPDAFYDMNDTGQEEVMGRIWRHITFYNESNALELSKLCTVEA